MSDQKDVQQLRLTHFLRRLDDEAIRQLAEELKPIELKAGEAVLVQGDPVDGLYVVTQGALELISHDRRGEPGLVSMLRPGSTLGAYELLSGLASQWTARAEGDSRVLLWPKASLYAFMEANPSALASLRLSASSSLLASQLRFDWLSEDETVYGLARKHPFFLIMSLAGPVMLLSGAAGLGWLSAAGAVGLGLWAALALGVVGVGYGVWKWVDWHNDFYVVTDRRVVWLEKIVAFYDSRREAPLHQVLALSVGTSVLGRALDYGDVTIRTFTGRITFRRVARPHAMAALIEEHWRRSQLRRQEADQESKLDAVRQVLGEDQPEAKNAPTPTPASANPLQAQERPHVGLDHWGFELRFEQDGVITYRKHWAVLLEHIGPPSAAIILVVAAMGARLGGLVPLLDLSTFMPVSLGLLALLGIWWAYQYLDWANDIYQVSHTHVLDVYKRPLGRELRRAAPLENLLSTEVDQRGLPALVLNFGDVRMNVGTEQLDFEGVFDPRSVQQDIVRAQEAFMEAKRQDARRNQRDEMVEWLKVYHEESRSRSQHEEDQDIDVYP